MHTEVLITTFDSPSGADALFEDLKDLQSEDFIELLDAVIVTKDDKNHVKIRQPLEVGPGKGAAFGAISGAIIGLLAGPAGAAVGLVSGALTGGVAGAAFEAGLPTEEIKSLALQELPTNGSALFVYLDEVWIDQVEQAALSFGASIHRQVLAEERKAERAQRAELRKEKIEERYAAWQANLAEQRKAITGLGTQVSAAIQSDRAGLQQQAKQAHAKLGETYQHMLYRLKVWQQELDDQLATLNGEIQQANAEAKASIEQQIDAAHAAQQELKAKVKATLTAQIDDLTTELAVLKAQAATKQSAANQAFEQRITQIQADVAAERQRIAQLDTTTDAAWTTLVQSIGEAISSYWKALGEAKDTFDQQG